MAPANSPLARLEIAFRPEGDTTRYRVNGEELGEGDAGLSAVLDLVRAHPEATVILLTAELPLGGESLPGATPLAARFPELLAALGQRKLRWSAE